MTTPRSFSPLLFCCTPPKRGCHAAMYNVGPLDEPPGDREASSRTSSKACVPASASQRTAQALIPRRPWGSGARGQGDRGALALSTSRKRVKRNLACAAASTVFLNTTVTVTHTNAPSVKRAPRTGTIPAACAMRLPHQASTTYNSGLRNSIRTFPLPQKIPLPPMHILRRTGAPERCPWEPLRQWEPQLFNRRLRRRRCNA